MADDSKGPSVPDGRATLLLWLERPAVCCPSRDCWRLTTIRVAICSFCCVLKRRTVQMTESIIEYSLQTISFVLGNRHWLLWLLFTVRDLYTESKYSNRGGGCCYFLMFALRIIIPTFLDDKRLRCLRLIAKFKKTRVGCDPIGCSNNEHVSVALTCCYWVWAYKPRSLNTVCHICTGRDCTAIWQLQPKVVQTVQRHVSYEFL